MSEPIELRPAWSFDCDRCGAENFVRAVVPCSLEGLLPEGMELGDFEGGEWVSKPDRVECQTCGAGYDVEEEE